MKKALILFGKVLSGIFAFYLFVSLVVIPIVVPPVVRSQASKILRHPVQLRSVWFNPFLWKLTVRGFSIQGSDRQVMLGFDRLGVNLSFIRLFAKEIRVESIEMEGLTVNAVMSEGGKINLLELASATVGTGNAPVQPPSAPATTVPSTAAKQSQLPLVVVDRITLGNGTVRFTDTTVKPGFITAFTGVECNVTGVSTRPDCKARVVFKTRLDEKGLIAVEAEAKPFCQPIQLETDITLSEYVLRVLTPYTGKYTGRAVRDGKLDFKIVYRIGENKLTASHKLLIQKFSFGEKVESKDALNLPFGLAVALLEDPQGRISISLPVTGDMSSPTFHYFHLIGEVARNFFIKLVTKPFMFLASFLGSDAGVEEMGYVRFVPGQAVLSDAEKAKLDTITRGLKERPKLFLEVNANFDPETDWKALKTEALEKEYRDLRKNSQWPDSRLYQIMYVPRFGLRSYRKLLQETRGKKGAYDFEKANSEVKRLLLEKSSGDRAVLDALGQARAQAIYDYMLANGFEEKRIGLRRGKPVQGSMGYVPLELTLTVFGEGKDESPVSADK